MDGARGADGAVAALRSHPRKLLITVLFGDMVASTVFYVVSFLMITDLVPPGYTSRLVVLSLIPLFVNVIGGDVIPKNLAVTFYHPVGRAAALPLLLMEKAVTPVLVPLEKLADAAASVFRRGKATVGTEDLQVLVALSAREGALEEGAAQMIIEVMGLSSLEVGELMQPRSDMIKFNLREPEEQLLSLFRREKVGEILVYDGDVDDMHGVLHLKDVLFKEPQQKLSDLVRPVPFLPETATAEDALLSCRREGTRTAIIVDEYGSVAGQVTVEDVLEEIVGEIANEYEPERLPDVVPLEGGVFRVQGSLRLRELRQLPGVRLPALRAETVGGLVMALLEKLPHEGDTVRCGNVEFVVEAVTGRRAATVLVHVTQGEAPAGQDERGRRRA
jgi:CBS domain containing-hemolysin-like protein